MLAATLCIHIHIYIYVVAILASSFTLSIGSSSLLLLASPPFPLLCCSSLGCAVVLRAGLAACVGCCLASASVLLSARPPVRLSVCSPSRPSVCLLAGFPRCSRCFSSFFVVSFVFLFCFFLPRTWGHNLPLLFVSPLPSAGPLWSYHRLYKIQIHKSFLALAGRYHRRLAMKRRLYFLS